MRKLAVLVSEGFIWSVGITRPKPGKERGAGRYITGILVLTLALVFGMFLLLKSQLL